MKGLNKMKIDSDLVLNIFCKKCTHYIDCPSKCTEYNNFKIVLDDELKKTETFRNKKIIKIGLFLEKNGWKKDSTIDSDYDSWIHPYNYGIDVSKEDGDIVVIAEEGDIFHIELSYHSVYTLIGFLITHPCDILSFDHVL